MNKTTTSLALAVIIIGGAYIYNNRPAGEGSSVRIGAALGLSGLCANWGEGEQKSINLAVDEANKNGGINGKTIDVTIEDTQCDPKATVNAIQKLVNVDKVAAIIGPTWGDSFQGGYSVLNSAKMVSISPSAAFESLFYNKQDITYAFSTWFPEREDINVVQNYAQKMNQNRIAIVHDTDTFGLMLADIFGTEAPTHNLQVIKEYKLPIGYSDFRTVIVELKSLKPQAIFTSFQDPQTKVEFLKQARELGLTAQLLSSTDIENPSLLKDFGSVMEGVVYGYADYAGNYAEFERKYKARYSTAPEGPAAANAYDAARVLIAALIEHDKNGTDLKTAVERTVMSGTIVQELKFDSKHQITGATFLTKTIKNGEFIVLE